MFSRLSTLALMTCTAAIASPALAAAGEPAPAPQADAALAERIAALVERSYPADEPGVAVVVTRAGELVYSGGRGIAAKAREEGASGAPIAADTRFRYASITKQFTAAVILQLVQEGSLSLDDSLSDMLPDYPGAGGEATLRQLLNHTSGIKSYTGMPGWMVEANTARAFTTSELIAEFADQPVDFAPGEAFAYNNSAYIILGAIIERVTGAPWYEAVDARIARPLGLTSLGYRTDESATPGFATGYSDEGEDRFGASQAIHPSVPGPAGSLSGTVGDLARWNAALHGGEVLDREHYAMMIAPTAIPGGEDSPYGFGLGNSEIRGRPAIGHSGGIFGFVTDSVYLPQEDLFVAVLANSDTPPVGPGTTMARIAALVLGDPHPQFTATTPDLAALEPFFGVYEISPGVTRQFFARDGQLYTIRSGARRSEVFAAGEGRFFYGPDSLNWFALRLGDDGIPVMAMHQGGAEVAEIALRSGSLPDTVEIPRATLERYRGSYRTPVGVAVLAVREDGVLTIKLESQPAFALVPTGDGEFAIEEVGAAVTMVEDADAVTGLTIRQGGQELPGERIGDAE